MLREYNVSTSSSGVFLYPYLSGYCPDRVVTVSTLYMGRPREKDTVGVSYI